MGQGAVLQIGVDLLDDGALAVGLLRHTPSAGATPPPDDLLAFLEGL